MSHFGLGFIQTGEAGTPFRYFRLDVTDIDGGTRLLVVELEIFAGATEYPTSNMISNTAPSPLVSSASSENNPAWHAFDGGTNNWEVTSGTSGWLQIDLK